MKNRIYELIVLFPLFLTGYSFARERVLVKEVIQLTKDGNYKYCPSWSPSGEKMALTMKKDDNFDIYILDLNKSEFARLTRDERIDGEPRWSPKSERILFESNRKGKWDILSINADGTDEKVIVTSGITATWLPDGENFIYAKEDYPVKTEGNLRSVNIKTGEEKAVFSDLERKLYPVVSPNGQKVAFIKSNKGNSEIWVGDLKSGEEQLIVNDGAFPTWSSDGKMIAFVTRGNNYNNIELYDFETKEQALLLENYAHIRSPAWSPDGKRIAFVSNKNGNYEIWLMILNFEE